MENIHYRIFHPQPPKGGFRSELRQSKYAAKVPFRGFRGKSSNEYSISKQIHIITNNNLNYQ
jgi:hypothetical protein